MGSIEQKLQYLLDTKSAIRQAIIDKGVAVTDEDTFRSYADKIQNIPVDGVKVVEESDVNLYDYDGTLLYSYTREEVLDMESFPNPPSKVGLVFQKWNYDIDEAKELISQMDFLDIGALYITNDGKTRLYISYDSDVNTLTTIQYNQDIANGVEVDWGDGSEIFTNSSTGNVSLTHTYATKGKYCITLNPKDECTLNLGWSTSTDTMGTSATIVPLFPASHTYYGLYKAELGKNIKYLYGTFYMCYNLRTINIPYGVISISRAAFYNAGVKALILPDSLQKLSHYGAYSCESLEVISIPKNVNLGAYCLEYCRKLYKLSVNRLSGNSTTSTTDMNYKGFKFGYNNGIRKVSLGTECTSIGHSDFYNTLGLQEIFIPPTVRTLYTNAFDKSSNILRIDFSAHTQIANLSGSSSAIYFVKSENLKILVPEELYEEWIAATNWTNYADYIYPVKTECTSLVIKADDVRANATTTTIKYGATLRVYNEDGTIDYKRQTGGTSTSEAFEKNESYDNAITREISFTYKGLTATTTITQAAKVPANYVVNLNDQWRESTSIANPDSAVYDGVYESFSNYNINSGYATMYVDIDGYTDFKLYIRSYAESTYDYVMVSQPDKDIKGNTSYSDTSLVKAYTRGLQNSGTAISSYKEVAFTGLDGGYHRITIVYRKDSSGNSGTDRGYVLIPKEQ